jgi:hypothetical protein
MARAKRRDTGHCSTDSRYGDACMTTSKIDVRLTCGKGTPFAVGTSG